MRKLMIAAFCLTILAHTPMPAYAQADLFDAQEEAAEKPGGGMRTVTPINKCLDQLPEAEAIEVRGNYLKPYQECQRRLHTLKRTDAKDDKDSGKKRSKKSAKDDADEDDGEERVSKKAPPPAEDARNFVRVRKDDSPRRPANYGDTAAPEAPKTLPGQGSRSQLYNR